MKYSLTRSAARSKLKHTNMFVSEDAVDILMDKHELWLDNVVNEAAEIAKSNLRKTILDRDIELAITRVTKRESL